MPANYVLLEKITVGAAGASSVTFSSIPQTGYTDLLVKISSRSTSNGGYTYVTFNGSTTPYTTRDIVNSNGTVVSAAYSLPGGVSWMTQSSYTASTFTNSEVYIPNYTSANNKSFSLDSFAENNSTNYVSGLEAALWSNTAAITSITCTPNTANYAEFSTFYLYGVAKLGTTPAIVPYATGGDTIMTDGTYWYHTFLSSGTFTPQKGLTCDYLVVAGGGGGGQTAFGGGGGAGGFRSTVTATGGGGSLESPLSLGTSAYTVTVGAGGAASTTGSNSVFSTITSNGGGGGGYYFNVAAKTGGSGGGGAGGDGTKAGAAGTANQGYAGGSGSEGDPTYVARVGGGGGGAGAVGANAVSSVSGGNGGAGVASVISGSSVTRGGGGGGSDQASAPSGPGAGGAGGGGGGGDGTTPGVAGTANTGGGGGGAGNGAGSAGGAGGSGVVIIRYAV